MVHGGPFFVDTDTSVHTPGGPRRARLRASPSIWGTHPPLPTLTLEGGLSADPQGQGTRQVHFGRERPALVWEGAYLLLEIQKIHMGKDTAL